MDRYTLELIRGEDERKEQESALLNPPRQILAPQPAVAPRQPAALAQEVQQTQAPTAPARPQPIRNPPTWKEVTQMPEMHGLSFDDLEDARHQYFVDVVAPGVTTEDLDAARAAFDADTKPSKMRMAIDKLNETMSAIGGGGEGGYSVETLDQLERSYRGLKQGVFATDFTASRRALDVAERIDRGESIEQLLDPRGARRYGVGPSNDPFTQFALEYQRARPERRPETKKRLEESYMDDLRTIAKEAAEISGLYHNPNAQEAIEAANTGQWRKAWEAFAEDPAGIIKDLTLSNAAQMVPMAGLGIAGAAVKGVPGLMLGFAGGSFPVDYAMSLVEYMNDQGIDLKDYKAVDAKLREPDFLDKLQNYAALHATGVALGDAAAAGLMSPVRGGVLKATGAAAKNVGLGVTGESGGEALGQVLATGQIKPGDVIAEGLAAGPVVVGGSAAQTIAAQRAASKEAVPAARTAPPAADRATGEAEPTATIPIGEESLSAADLLGAPPARRGAPAPATPALEDRIGTINRMLGDIAGKIQEGGNVEHYQARAKELIAERVQLERAQNPDVDAEALQRQNRDRSRAASVVQMQEIANAPDYDRLATAPIPDVGAPMVSVKGDTALPAVDIGKASVVTLGDGTKVPVKYAVVEADSVLASHNADGKQNPEYFGNTIPAGRVVAMTNGRVAGLQAAYTRDTAKPYVEKLLADPEHGVSAEAIRAKQRPMLVRVFDDAYNKLPRLAELSNTGGSAPLSGVEKARGDAARITSLEGFAPSESGDVGAVSNMPFVRQFMQALPKNEQAELMTATGELSQEGARRLRAAVFAKAYGGGDALARMVESTDDNVRSIVAGLMRAAPAVARLREKVAAGALQDLDITADVLRAVEEISRLRDAGVSVGTWLAQADMFGALSPELVGLLEFLEANARSGRRIAEFLERYLAAAEAIGAPGGLFEDTKPPSKADVVRTITKEMADERQTGLPQGAQPAAAAPGSTAPSGAAAGAQPSPGAGEPVPAGKEREGGKGAQVGPALIVEEKDGRWWVSDTAGDLAEFPTEAQARRFAENMAQRTPTVTVMQQAIDKVGEARFQELVKARMERAASRNLPQEEQVIVEATARDIVGDVDPLKAELEDALSDLGGWVEKNLLPKAAMIDDAAQENLLPILTRLFTVAIKMGHRDLAKATKFVMGEIRKKAAQLADLINDALLERAFKEAQDAGTVRSDQGQAREGGRAAGGGEVAGGADLQRQPKAGAAPGDQVQPRRDGGEGDQVGKKTGYRPGDRLVVDGDKATVVSTNEGADTITVRIAEGGVRTIKSLAGLMDFAQSFPVDVELADKKARALDETHFIQTPERIALRKSVAKQTAARGARLKSGKDVAVRKEKQFYYLMGLPASGKSAVASQVQQEHGAHIIDADIAKELFPEFANGLGASALHVESADIAEGLLHQSFARGENIIYPGVGKGENTVRRLIASARKEGYEVHLYFVDLPIEKAMERVVKRFRQTGRFIPPGYLKEVGGKPRQVFEAIRKESIISSWSDYSNDVPFGSKPRLLARGPEGARQDDREGVRPQDAGAVERERDAGLRSGQGRGTVQLQESEGVADERPQPTRRPEGPETGQQPEGAARPADERAERGRQMGLGLADEGEVAGGGREAARTGEGTGRARAEGARGREDGREAERRAGLRDTPGERGPAPAVVVPSNYVITAKDDLGGGGDKTKARRNLRAIALLKDLTQANRQANPEEQAILVGYVGWGGLKQTFDEGNADWAKERAELKDLLTPKEYEAARRSVLDAHYTSEPVVRGIYQALEHMGFNGGSVLEPGMGIGHFIGLMPPSMQSPSKFVGVELDPITGGIAQQLYPNADVKAPRGFQEVNIPAEGYFDAAVGNPPFGSQTITDETGAEIPKLSIHNFFFAKAVHGLRPGGLLAMVTSHYFLDARESQARNWIAKRAEFLGAIRLPNTAFQKTAGTEVTTDIVFLRKLEAGEKAASEKAVSWTKVGQMKDEATGEPITVNTYFLKHPEMMLGKMTLGGTMYGKGEATLEANKGEDLGKALEKAVGMLPQALYRPASRPIEMSPEMRKELEEARKGRGKPSDKTALSRADQTQTPEFKKWFGKSKVVDAEGKPLVVYHGTSEAFSTFARNKVGQRTNERYGTPAFFFTSDPEAASGYAKDAHPYAKNNVMPLYLSFQNPLELDAEGSADWHRITSSSIKEAKQKANDGVIIKNVQDRMASDFSAGGFDVYVAFRPEQIKSAIGNRGAFDPASPDIRLSRTDSFRRGLAGMTHADVNAVADIFRKGFAGIPPIHVLESVSQAPAELRKDIKALGGESDTAGAWHNGEEYLFAENINSPMHAEWVILHESTHHGLRGMLGNSTKPLFMDIYMKNGEIRKLANEQRARNPNLSIVAATEEVLANMGADGVPQSVWAQIIAWVRKVLRKAGVRLELSDGDIRSLVAEALRFVKEKPEKTHLLSGTALGKPRGAEQTQTPEFKRWFGDSKVVDAEGKPLVVYHGTVEDFDAFDTTLFNEIGSWFTATPKDETFGDVDSARRAADEFAATQADLYGGNERIIPVYLSIENPKKFSGYNSFLKWSNSSADGPALRARLEKQGFDGIVIRNSDTDPNAEVNVRDDWVAFHPEQIKSAIGNRGTFDPESADIRLSRAVGQPARPLPPAVRGGYRAWAAKTVQNIDNWLDPIGKLPEREEYLVERYKTLGVISRADELAAGIRAAFQDASPEDKQQVYDYLVTAGATPDKIKDLTVRANAEKVKGEIATVGDALVERGMLSEESREKYRDGYLPRLYLKHLLSEADFSALGAGKKPSNMGYLKERKDIPEDVRKVILGEITDPGYLASVAVAKPLRDMVLLDWLAKISEKDEWVLPNVLVEWGDINLLKPAAFPQQFGQDLPKRKVSVYWLKDEALRLRKQADYQDKPTAARAHDIANEMDRAANRGLDKMPTLALEGRSRYKQIPDTARYGRMRGVWVRREIFDDLMGVHDFIPADPSLPQRLLGYGGVGTRITQIWKTLKVALNPPGQVRNFVSNGVLLNLSGVAFPMVPVRVAQAIGEIYSNGEHWKIAKKYGIKKSTFASEELYRAKNDLLALEREASGMHPMAALQHIGVKIMKAGGDLYQLSEWIFKTAKIIDEMAKGKTEAKAMLEAQKWLFDYSLVPPWVRYLRGAPIGVPFLTFPTKAFPRMVETALLHPHRFLPYAAILYGMAYAVASMYDVDGDDLEKLKKALPEWLRNRGHAMLLPFKDEQGRWQVVDLGYFFPWTQFTEVAGAVKEGEPGKAIRSAGLISGPLLDMAVAIKTGKDAFTNREIYKPGDPPERQAVAIMNYLWTMAAPPFLTDTGALGHGLRAATGETNKFGDPISTPVQAGLRLFGVNVYAMHPKQSREANLRKMEHDTNEVRQAAKDRLADRSLSPERRSALIREYTQETQRRAGKIQQYIKESEIHPNLRTER